MGSNSDLGKSKKSNRKIFKNNSEFKEGIYVALKNADNDLNKSDISEDLELDRDLKTALKGTSILFIGNIIDTILGVICTILVARFFTVGEYGIYGLTVNIILLFLSISGLGVHEANSRFIAFYRGKKDDAKIVGIMKTSFLIVIVSTTLFALSLFFLSDFIANDIFGIGRLSTVLKIFVISMPFWAILNVVVSVFRGYESAKENVYFNYLSIQILKTVLFVLVIFLGLILEYIIIAFLIAILITFVISVVYFFRKFYDKFKINKKSGLYFKEILSFSWPLIFTSLAWFLITGLDKVMLGILRTEVEVGLYNAATPIASHLNFFYIITVFIFQPIATRLYSEGKIEELTRNYQVLTKWLFTLAFPFITVLLLFPEAVITIFYGGKYVSASPALQIITIGVMVFLILSLSREILAIMGKTRIIMYCTMAGGGINVVLNYFLIQKFGINGAAIATTIAFIIINGLIGLYLYKTEKIHPFRRNLIIPMVISLLILCLLYVLILIYNLNNLSLLFKVLLCFSLIVSYFIIILKTESIDKEDIQLYLFLEKKMGARFKFLSRIIRKIVGFIIR